MRNIVFHDKTKTFHLYNEKISYIMCVLENGHMGQIYFGKKIHDKEDFSYLVEKIERPMTCQSVNGMGQRWNYSSKTLTTSNTLNYVRSFDKHNLTAMVYL